MEEASHGDDSVSGPASVPEATDRAPAEDALRGELAKWRERVPKLAAALRQKAEESAALRCELERLRSIRSAPDTAAGIRVRDEVIAELEGKLADLAQRHNVAEGESHRHKLEVDELRGDVEAWKAKWQSLTRTLDSQAAEENDREQHHQELKEAHAALAERLKEAEWACRERARAIEEVTEERDSLQRRNEQLFETTELANRQIGSLSDSLAELRVLLKQHREREAELEARLQAAVTDSVAAEGRHAEKWAGANQERAALESRLGEQRREVERLTEVVAVAQRTTNEREAERRELSERLQRVEARNLHLEEQLAERSALVVTLERDLEAAASARQTLEAERDELEAARIRAERHRKESADYVTRLDAKLERQQELIGNLEKELADARDDRAGPKDRAHPQPSGAADKVMLVLNQQLADARTRNDALLARIHHLEAELTARTTAATSAADDLTRIHGIGQKLAEQLNELGIHHYRQIAELDESELANQHHVLHGHRGRIVRDGWIEQAVRLISH